MGRSMGKVVDKSLDLHYSQAERFSCRKALVSAKHRSAPPNQRSPFSAQPRLNIGRKPPSSPSRTTNLLQLRGTVSSPWRLSELSRPPAYCAMPCARGWLWPPCPAASKAPWESLPMLFPPCPAPTSPTTTHLSTRLPRMEAILPLLLIILDANGAQHIFSGPQACSGWH